MATAANSVNYHRLFASLLLLIGACAALGMLLDNYYQVSIPPISTILIVLLILVQVLNFFLSAFAWRYCLRKIVDVSITFPAAATHVAMVLIGKYIPGKVWGMLGRAAHARSCGATYGRVVTASLLEQVATVWVGIFVGTSLWLTNLESWILTLFAVAVTAICLFSIGIYRILGKLLLFLSNLSTRLQPLATIDNSTLLAIRNVVSVNILQWLGVGLYVGLLAYCLGMSGGLTDYLTIAGAMILSVNVGFAALFAPGGIGVREGTFVALASSVLPIEQALMVAVFHRLTLTAYDVVAGIVGLLLEKVRVSDQA